MAGGSPTQTKRAAGFVILGGLAATALMLFLMAQIHAEITDPWLVRIDTVGMAWVHRWTSAVLTPVMFALTFAGSVAGLMTAVLLGVLWLWWRREWYELVGLLCAVGGATLLNTLLKVGFHRQRPTVPWALIHEPSFSFPSGHAMISIVFYGSVAYALCQRLPSRLARTLIVLVAALLILGIGVSRAYLGVHYPSDIGAGWLAGGIWLAVTIWGVRILHRSRVPAT